MHAIRLTRASDHGVNVMLVRSSFPRSTKRSILLGLVLALVFGGATAYAESFPASAAEADTHDLVCKCGSQCRRGACCCGSPSPARRLFRPSASRTIADGRELGPSLCRCAPPSGAPGLPSSTSSLREGELAALAFRALWRPSVASERLIPPASSRRHPRLPSRIERPPRPQLSV